MYLLLYCFFILGNALIAVNKAAVQERQPIENEYFRLARPTSSITGSGKQGRV